MERSIPVSRVEAMLRDIDRKLSELDTLKIQRETLRKLLENGSSEEREDLSRPATPPGPTAAVLAVLSEHGPLTSKQIVEHARRRVDSRASNLDRNLQATIHNLKGKKKIVEFNGLFTIMGDKT